MTALKHYKIQTNDGFVSVHAERTSIDRDDRMIKFMVGNQVVAQIHAGTPFYLVSETLSPLSGQGEADLGGAA